MFKRITKTIWMNVLKETSGLALFSFFLAAFSWMLGIFNLFLGLPFISPILACKITQFGSGVAALSGIIALIYTIITRSKGKWFAIFGIILGTLGFFAFTCLIN